MVHLFWKSCSNRNNIPFPCKTPLLDRHSRFQTYPRTGIAAVSDRIQLEMLPSGQCSCLQTEISVKCVALLTTRSHNTSVLETLIYHSISENELFYSWMELPIFTSSSHQWNRFILDHNGAPIHCTAFWKPLLLLSRTHQSSLLWGRSTFPRPPQWVTSRSTSRSTPYFTWINTTCQCRTNGPVVN